VGQAHRVFREAGRDDIGGILRLYDQLHPDDPPLDEATLAATVERILATDGLHLFVIDRDGVIVATTYLNVIPNLTRGGTPYALIENVVVDESCRRTGVGREIVTGTLAAAWAAGCYKTMLLTGATRTGNHAFYRACGFSGDAKAGFLATPT